MFVGYVQSIENTATAQQYEGKLTIAEGSNLIASYTDIADGSDSSTTAAMVDPFGVVFNSQNGIPLDGAQVTLINVATGSPATVYGDDGVSNL